MAPPTTTSVNGRKINEVPIVNSYEIINVLRYKKNDKYHTIFDIALLVSSCFYYL